MVEQLLKLQEKYEIGVIDLWNDAEMNQVSEEDYKLYMFDASIPRSWLPELVDPQDGGVPVRLSGQ